MTVSNVLNGKPGASQRTREVVMEAVRELGYRPNVSARGLKRGRTGLVGVLALDLTNQYSLELIRGIADELAAAEHEVLISATYQDAARETDRVRFLTSGIVDGVLLIAPVVEPETLDVLQSSSLPVVVIDPRRLDLDLPRVSVDNHGGTFAGTRHLIELGHRHIAYLGGDPDFESAAERERGFRDAMAASGLPVDPDLVRSTDFSYAGGQRAACELLAAHEPTAIVAAADLIAFGALDVARARSLDVPGRLSIVGFDDLPQAAQSFPGLTTVRQPLHEMGTTAVRMLLSRLDGPAGADHVRLPTSLVLRGTTAGVPLCT